MLDALCRRAPEVASARRRMAERCIVLLVVGNNNNVERYSLVGRIATTCCSVLLSTI